jgi:hypothetical protein
MANETTLSVAVALSLDNGLKIGLAGVIQQVKEADKAADSFIARLEKINRTIRLLNDIAAGGKKLYQLFKPEGAAGAPAGGLSQTLDRARAQSVAGAAGHPPSATTGPLERWIKILADPRPSSPGPARRGGTKNRASARAAHPAGGRTGQPAPFDPFASAKRVADFYLKQTKTAGKKGQKKNKTEPEAPLKGPVATLAALNRLVQALPKLTGKPLPANLGPLLDGITKAAIATSKDPALLAALSQTFGALSRIFISSGLQARLQAIGPALTRMGQILDSGLAPALRHGMDAVAKLGPVFRGLGTAISGPVSSALDIGIKFVGLFGRALSGLGMVLMANPVIAGITIAIALILGALWYFRDALGGIGEAIGATWKRLKDLFHFGGDGPQKTAAGHAAPAAGKTPAAVPVPPVPARGAAPAAQPANLYLTHEGRAVLIATVTAGQGKAASRPPTGGRQLDSSSTTIRPGMGNYAMARG